MPAVYFQVLFQAPRKDFAVVIGYVKVGNVGRHGGGLTVAFIETCISPVGQLKTEACLLMIRS